MAFQAAATTPPPPARLLPVAVLLWLAGVYLRIPVLVAPPLAPFIGDELALTQALTGALTTLPILMLAIGAMPGSLAIARIGPRNTLALAMVMLPEKALDVLNRNRMQCAIRRRMQQLCEQQHDNNVGDLGNQNPADHG